MRSIVYLLELMLRSLPRNALFEIVISELMCSYSEEGMRSRATSTMELLDDAIEFKKNNE